MNAMNDEPADLLDPGAEAARRRRIDERREQSMTELKRLGFNGAVGPRVWLVAQVAPDEGLYILGACTSEKRAKALKQRLRPGLTNVEIIDFWLDMADKWWL